MPNSPSGLSASEAAERLRRGLGNRSPRTDVRDYALIVARNLGTGFNAMVAPAAVLLFSLGDLRAAVAVSGMAIVNTLLSLAQEIRAKVHLDQLSLLTESKVRVRRDGETIAISAGEVVQGDDVALSAGDMVVADGSLLDSQALEIDESLLTGESDPVRRTEGERVLSGSACVAGEGWYRADAVGAASFAQKTSAAARRYHASSSPLTRSINRIVRYLSYAAIGLCLVHALGWRYQGLTDDEAVRRVAATITTMVPQGLVLAATLAFIVGALAMARRGAIVQRLSAVETMAAIDVVCTDKTGTLTTNHLTLELLHPLDSEAASEKDVRAALALFASASVDRTNRNVVAIVQSLGAVPVETLERIAFKSRLRYSAVRIRDGARRRLLVLGAIEALASRCSGLLDRSAFDTMVGEHQVRGMRLLLFAEGDADSAFAENGELPDGDLHPLALVGFADELRSDAGRVLEALYAQGIQFKVISGDNPATVQGTVRHLDLPIARDPAVSGDELTASPERDNLIARRGVFGRIAPEQKVQIVKSLQASGRRVAMIGDGVNDVLSIKAADLGIAMGSGSSAARTVAGLVLEGDRFELLPEVLEEGRTIVRNLRRSAKLFLTKNVYSFILILASYSGLGLPFPFVPQQVTLLNWSVIGIPALAIAMSRQRADRVTARPFLREVLGFALRTGIVFGLGGLAILKVGMHLFPDEVSLQRTLFLSMLIVLGMSTLFRALTDGEPADSAGDRGFRLLGLLAIPIYLTAMYLPPAQRFFELTPLDVPQWALVAAFAAICWGATLLADRWSRR